MYLCARVAGRLLPLFSPACSQLGQAARVCAASQAAGALCIRIREDSTVTMSITDGVITGCSVEAGRDNAVRFQHVAQRESSVGVLG